MSDRQDYSAYRSASSHPLTPFPLPVLERISTLGQLEEIQQREAALDRGKEVRYRKVVIGSRKHYSVRDLADLEYVTLGAEGRLNCDQIAFGKRLVLRIISSVVRTASIQLVAEDTKGNVANVGIYSSPAHTAAELNQIYHRDTIFAIREPFIKSFRNDWIIRIDSPSDLVRLYPASALLLDSNGDRLFLAPTMTKQQYQQAGNRHFSDSRWIAALQSYTAGLDLPPRDRSSTTILSNRAATLLKLGRPSCALKDCERALSDDGEMDPSLRRKLVFRAATAEYDLGRYDAAMARFPELMIGLDSTDRLVNELIRRTKERIIEQSTGIYPWPHLFSIAQTGSSLDVAEFVGPVEVQSIAKRGKGLMASRDVKMGELLLVAKPLAITRGDQKRLSYTFGVNLLTETIDPYSFTELVAELMERAMNDEDFYLRICQLSDNAANLSGIPSPASILCSSSPLSLPQTTPTSAHSTIIDPSKFEAISTFNSFHPDSILPTVSDPSTYDDDDDINHVHSPSALYFLPSFMNHSCMGNVSYVFIGDVLVLRAKRSISRGEELVDTYLDSLDEYEKRKLKLDKHGFECDCSLCTADREDQQEQRDKRKQLAEEVGRQTELLHHRTENGGKAAVHSSTKSTLLALIDQILATYSTTRAAEMPRPALYRCYRLLAQLLADEGLPKAAIDVELKGIEALGGLVVCEDDAGAREKWKMKRIPIVGGVNAVLSALFVATQFLQLGEATVSRSWIEMAKTMESGSSGVDLFASRYSDWARRKNLSIEEQ